jgi:acyl-CoA thioester hydrolase
LHGGSHLLPVRVYYEDTDAGGIVYHATYLRYAERARTEMLRAVGIDLNRLRDDHGLLFVVRRGEIDYQKSAQLDDVLMVQSDLVELGGATATINQAIRRVTPSRELGEGLATFRAFVACVQTTGRAGRLPADVRARMKTLMKSPGGEHGDSNG